MSTLTYASAPVETRPDTSPIPAETIPANPNDPFGVHRSIIEEIEELGRRHAEP